MEIYIRNGRKIGTFSVFPSKLSAIVEQFNLDSNVDWLTVTRQIKLAAGELGFASVGIAPAVEPPGYSRLLSWIESGYAGEMDYIGRRKEAYQDPNSVMEGTRSIVMLTLPYKTVPRQELEAGQGRISRYAWGTCDYHDWIHDRLRRLQAVVDRTIAGATSRGVVDSAPLMERDFAQLAGLGWIGKNSLLLNQSLGSYFFLAALLTNLPLVIDVPSETGHCGTCTACLDACPTSAFIAPQVLDASKCISYLTIEHRGHIPLELRPKLDDWIFGCDVCQDVCPWNRRSPQAVSREFWPQSSNDPVDLRRLLEINESEFRERFRKTPLWRARRRQLVRNAIIVLANQRDESVVDSMIRLLSDQESIIRAAAAWGLAELQSTNAIAAISAAFEIEADAEVREEFEQALRALKEV